MSHDILLNITVAGNHHAAAGNVFYICRNKTAKDKYINSGFRGEGTSFRHLKPTDDSELYGPELELKGSNVRLIMVTNRYSYVDTYALHVNSHK